MNLSTILSSPRLSYFLLDASGVLYTDNGPINNIATTVKQLQNKGPVYITTNNSSFSISKIQKKLNDIDIIIPQENIISSGLGLKDDGHCHELITQKSVYIFGYKSSYAYITRSHFKAILPTPDHADVIILTSSYRDEHQSAFKTLLASLKERPRPIICCNPDKHVIGKNGLINVIGYYASIIEKETQLPILWFGKPYSNYSLLVHNTLRKHHPHINFEHCYFFDDNLSNVITLQKDLRLNGCWIKESGISSHLDTESMIKSIGTPTYIMPQLELPIA